MSYLQETAEACERLLIKHEPTTDRIEAIRVTPAILKAVQREGFKVTGHDLPLPRVHLPKVEPAAGPLVDRRLKPDSVAPSMLAAREWLDQPKPRRLPQSVFALKHGVSVGALSISASRERAHRRMRHLAGDKTALLAARRKEGSRYGQGTLLAREFLANPDKWNSQTEFAAAKGVAVTTINSGVSRLRAARAVRAPLSAAADPGFVRSSHLCPVLRQGDESAKLRQTA